MKEIILILFITPASGLTELYEYPMPNYNRCYNSIDTAKNAEGVVMFCIERPVLTK